MQNVSSIVFIPKSIDCQKALSSTKKSLDDWRPSPPSSVTPGILQNVIFFEQCMNQSADCEIPNMPLWVSIVAVAQAIRILVERRCRWYERPKKEPERINPKKVD